MVESLDGCGWRWGRRRAVAAVGRSISLRALGLLPPASREVAHEGVERRLLRLGDERVLDDRLDLCERLLTPRLDSRDREDVVPVLRTDRADQPVHDGVKDGLVELAVQRALRDGGDLAAGALGRAVD